MYTLVDACIGFLPAGIANMTPVLANKVPYLNRWNTPVDFGHSIKGKRIFGDHKTWRGIITGTVCGSVFGLLLYHFLKLSFVPSNHLLFVVALSFGALCGDTIKSFFKRRSKVEPGKSWFPFDQIDYIIGGLAFIAPFGLLTFANIIAIFTVYFGLHLSVSYIGYRLGLKKDPI